MDISCGNIEIEPKSSVRYLLVTLDQDITRKTMVGNVVRKIDSVLRFLYRKSSFLKFRNQKLLCLALLPLWFNYSHNIYH